MSEKEFYKIGDIAKKLNITHRTIRYYDQLGLLPATKRTLGKTRLFDNDDLKIIKKIKELQKKDALPLSIIKEKLYGVNETKTTIKVLVNAHCILPKSDQNDVIEKLPDLDAITIDQHEDKISSFIHKLSSSGCTDIFYISEEKVNSDLNKHIKSISKSIKKTTSITVITIPSITIGYGLFTYCLAEQVQLGKSPDQIHLIASKLKNSLYEIGFTQGLSGIEDSNQTYLSKQIFTEIKSINHLFHTKLPDQIFQYHSVCHDTKDGLVCIQDQIKQIIEDRTNYVSYIFIGNHNLSNESEEMMTELKQKFPSTPIYNGPLTKLLASTKSPNSLWVAII